MSDPATGCRPPATGKSLLALGVAALTAAAIVVTGGNLAAAIAPALLAAAIVALILAPLRACVMSLIFLSILADAPQDNPMSGHWRSPLYGLGELLCNNLSTTFGVPMPLSGIDLIAIVLLVRVALSQRTIVAAPLRVAAGAFFAALVALAAAGAARGGNGDAAYWQVRQLAWMPGFIFLAAHALDDDAALVRLSRLILAAALIKSAVGFYFRFAIAAPNGIESPVILSHSETLLLCLSIAILAVRWLEQPKASALLYFPPILAAIWLNNRRLAWVGLTASAAILWNFVRWNAGKRALARTVLIALPLAVAYVAAGWQSDAPAFRPVAAARTVISPRRTVVKAGADSSTRAREIENFNLSQTLREHPLGTGLGHPYEEAIKGPDISSDFALYRYIPHNEVLWMMTAAGPFGFFLLWCLFAVGIFLAARSHRFARTPVERCAALASLCGQVLFLIQAWGDMGTQSWSAVWLASVSLATAGTLAVRTGAWAWHPAPQPVSCA
ncbi:MAG: O-antigen ligase family protein [Myxococcales bacterium]